MNGRRQLGAPVDRSAPNLRLPVVGGPLGHEHSGLSGQRAVCLSVACPDAKTRAVGERMSFSRKEWKGEYRRTTTCWQWTPPPGKHDQANETVARIGLVRHPTPAVMANHAETVAKRIREHGTQVLRKASVLAVRGLPSSTAGTGSRSADATTSVERAVGVGGDEGYPTPPDPEWIGIDAELSRLHRTWWALGERLLSVYDRVLSHGDDSDPIPAGTGSCNRCNVFCRPTADRPEFRIKAGYCPACHRMWCRLGKPDRFAFERTKDDDTDPTPA